LALGREDEGAIERMPMEKLASVCKTPLPRSSRKEINAMKRLRSFAGVDERSEELKENCHAARHPYPPQGQAGASDVLRILLALEEAGSDASIDARDECALSFADAALERQRDSSGGGPS